MNFAERFKADIISAVESIDIDEVIDVIELLKETKARGRNIFICANTNSGRSAAKVVSDMLTRSSFGRPNRFRVLALEGGSPESEPDLDGSHRDEIFMEQLKSFAQPGDAVVGISASGNSSAITKALDYGAQVGCKTVALTGLDAGRLGTLADVAVHVASTHHGTVEDTHVIICHMIGSYFFDADCI